MLLNPSKLIFLNNNFNKFSMSKLIQSNKYRINNFRLCVVFHNIRGRVEEKIKNLGYLDYIKTVYKPNYVFLSETMLFKDDIFKQRKDYHTIFQKPVKTIKNGFVNGMVGLTDIFDVPNTIEVEKTKFYLELETIEPNISLLHTYLRKKDDYGWNLVKNKLYSLVPYNDSINKPLIWCGDWNSKLGLKVGDKTLDDRGIDVINTCSNLKIDIMNEYLLYALSTWSTEDGSSWSILDCMGTQIWVRINYHIEMDIGLKYGSDHNIIAFNISINLKNKFPKLDNLLYFDIKDKYISYMYKSNINTFINRNENKSNLVMDNIVNKLYSFQYYDNYSNYRVRFHKFYIESLLKYNSINFRNGNNKIIRSFDNLNNIGYNFEYHFNNYRNKIISIRKLLINGNLNNIDRDQCIIRLTEYNNILYKSFECLNVIKCLYHANILQKLYKNNDSRSFFKVIDRNNYKQYPIIQKGGSLYDINKNAANSFMYFKRLMEPPNGIFWGMSNEYKNSFKCTLYDECPPLSDFIRAHKSINKHAKESKDYLCYDFMERLLIRHPNAYIMHFKLLWDEEHLSNIDGINTMVSLLKSDGTPRGIGISNYSDRILSILIWKYYIPEIEKFMESYQFGFKSKVGCSDCILLIIIMILQYRILHKKTMYLVLIDYKKAFPYIIVEQVFCILYHFIGINGKHFRILYNLSILNGTTIEIEGILTDIIFRYLGTKQGWYPSPQMYNIIHQIIMKFCLSSKIGIKFNIINIPNCIKQSYGYVDLFYMVPERVQKILNFVINFILFYIAYADDTTICTTNHNDAQNQLTGLTLNGNKFNAVVNTTKSSYIIFNKEYLDWNEEMCNQFGLIYEDGNIVQVNHGKFLGVILDDKLDFGKQVKYRIRSLGLSVSEIMAIIFKNILYNPLILENIFFSKIKSVIEFGIDIIPYKYNQLDLLNKSIIRNFKKIMGLCSKTRNDYINIMFNCGDIYYRFWYLQLKKFYNLISGDSTKSFTVGIYLLDMLYVKWFINNKHIKTIFTHYPKWYKLYTYRIYCVLKYLNLEKYFSFNINNMINNKKWYRLIQKRLKIKYNNYYYNKLKKKSNLLTWCIITQNKFLSKNYKYFGRKSLPRMIYEWCNNRNIHVSQLRLHRAFFSIILGSHFYHWSRVIDGIKYRLYPACLLCGSDWHQIGPWLHLLLTCKAVYDIIRLKNINNNRIEILFPENEWIDKSDQCSFYCEGDIFESLRNKYNDIMVEYNNNYINNTFYNSNNKSDNISGLADLNWSQLNYGIWALDKHEKFNLNILIENRYYKDNKI